MRIFCWMLCLVVPVLAAASPQAASVTEATGGTVVLQAGHPSLAKWLLPPEMPSPPNNRLTPERAELGKKLFFDPRLSATGQSTCASCHFPERGYKDFYKDFPLLQGLLQGLPPSSRPAVEFVLAVCDFSGEVMLR